MKFWGILITPCIWVCVHRVTLKNQHDLETHANWLLCVDGWHGGSCVDGGRVREPRLRAGAGQRRRGRPASAAPLHRALPGLLRVIQLVPTQWRFAYFTTTHEGVSTDIQRFWKNVKYLYVQGSTSTYPNVSKFHNGIWTCDKVHHYIVEIDQIHLTGVGLCAAHCKYLLCIPTIGKSWISKNNCNSPIICFK